MRSPSLLCLFARLAALSAGLIIFAPTPAKAVSGLYIQAGAGAGLYDTTELIVRAVGDNKLPNENTDECCPPTSLGANLRIGYSIYELGGPEFMFVGTGWNNFAGGAGFIGGGLRIYPLEIFDKLGIFDTDDFDLEITAGAAFGYAIVGEDFAYTGTFWDFDFGLDYKVTSFMNIGARVDIIQPQLDDFVFTSFSQDQGRCLLENGRQDLDNAAEPVARQSAQCAGNGPDVTLVIPQVVFTFHFDLF